MIIPPFVRLRPPTLLTSFFRPITAVIMIVAGLFLLSAQCPSIRIFHDSSFAYLHPSLFARIDYRFFFSRISLLLDCRRGLPLIPLEATIFSSCALFDMFFENLSSCALPQTSIHSPRRIVLFFRDESRIDFLSAFPFFLEEFPSHFLN